jgi:hypothetical protein
MTRTFRSVSVLFAVPVTAALVAIASLVPSTAHGHARLKNPQPRDNQDGYKDPPRTPPGTGAPCGISEASTQPHTPLTPGAAITVTWEETVNHPGCFVIDFSPANDANFTVLGVKSHMNAPAPANPTTTNPRQWSVGVTLPSTPCPKCTLRLRQLMLASDVADSACPPATIPSGSTYYSCANVALSGSGGATGGGGAGGAAGSSGTTGGRGGTTAAGGRGGTTGQAGASGQAGSTGQAGTSGQAGDNGQTGQAGTSGQAGSTGQTGQAGTSGQAGSSASGQAGTSGQAGSSASGQAGTSASGQAGNGTSGGAGSSGQTGTGASGGDGASGGCGIAGGQPAPWGLLLALVLLRRFRRRSRS